MDFLEIETQPFDSSLDAYFPFDDPMESLPAEALFKLFPTCGDLPTAQRYEENFQNVFTDPLAISICKIAESNSIVPVHDEAFQESIGTDQCPSSEVQVVNVECHRENFSNSWLVYDEKHGRERRPFLHEFIRMLLDNDEYSHIAAYIDRKHGIFKLFSSKEVAQLWKRVKGRNSSSSKSILMKTHQWLFLDLSFFRDELR